MSQQMVVSNMPAGRVWNAWARGDRRPPPAHAVGDLRTGSESVLLTPEDLKRAFPVPENALNFIAHARRTIRDILDGADHRLFVVVGPCSIHDPEAALEYARRLSGLAAEVSDTLHLVMRVYFEKPRTTTGWKGLINDPHLDGSFRINEGLATARQLLIKIAELGLPAATEALDPISQLYLQDLISWTAIGARTAESQTHREMASGLPSPIGFKNGTDGNLTVAVNAIKSSAQPHSFPGLNGAGRASIIRTRGNRHTHVVLRGGGGRPNYDAVSISLCELMLNEHGLKPNIMVDCSHANSQNRHEAQALVMQDVVNQIFGGNKSIKALMVESNLYAGSQPLTGGLAELRYGVSVTDPCIDWEMTEGCLSSLRQKLRHVLPGRLHAGERLPIEDAALPGVSHLPESDHG